MSIYYETVKVDVYPDEFKPIMKAIKYALLEGKDDLFNEKEIKTLESFLDDFCDIALNEAI